MADWLIRCFFFLTSAAASIFLEWAVISAIGGRRRPPRRDGKEGRDRATRRRSVEMALTPSGRDGRAEPRHGVDPVWCRVLGKSALVQFDSGSGPNSRPVVVEQDVIPKAKAASA